MNNFQDFIKVRLGTWLLHLWDSLLVVEQEVCLCVHLLLTCIHYGIYHVWYVLCCMYFLWNVLVQLNTLSVKFLMDHENYLLLCLSKWVHIKNSCYIYIFLFINKNTNQIRCFQMYTVSFRKHPVLHLLQIRVEFKTNVEILGESPFTKECPTLSTSVWTWAWMDFMGTPFLRVSVIFPPPKGSELCPTQTVFTAIHFRMDSVTSQRLKSEVWEWTPSMETPFPMDLAILKRSKEITLC